MQQFFINLEFNTKSYQMLEITSEVTAQLKDLNCQDGLLTLMINHTSASLTIQENADPSVQTDLINALARLAPENANYIHTMEGADDMPAHIKTSLTSVNLSIPVKNTQPILGTWQGIYLLEHRSQPHRRRVVFHFIGDVC